MLSNGINAGPIDTFAILLNERIHSVGFPLPLPPLPLSTHSRLTIRPVRTPIAAAKSCTDCLREYTSLHLACFVNSHSNDMPFVLVCCAMCGVFMRLPHPIQRCIDKCVCEQIPRMVRSGGLKICILGRMHASDMRRPALPIRARRCPPVCSGTHKYGSGSLNERHTLNALIAKWTCGRRVPEMRCENK